MGEYYRFLWQMTWPSMVGLTILIIFILGRLIWKGFTSTSGKSKWVLSLFIGKVLFWLGIIAVYLCMFLAKYPDWYYNPFFFTGIVEEKSYQQANSNYIVIIANDEKKIQLTINDTIYKYLGVNDSINVMYLPIRQDVIRCEILQQSNNTEE